MLSKKKKVFDFGNLVYGFVHIIQIFSYLYLYIYLIVKYLTNKALFLIK